VPEHQHAEASAPETAATVTPARAATLSPVQLALGLQRTAGNAATTQLVQRFVNPSARTTVTGQDDSALTQQRFTGSEFVRAAGEHESGVDADDIQQGQLGDCYFLSPLAAAARINPGRIAHRIRGPVDTQADGTRVYDVDLFVRRWIGNPSKRTMRVTDRFVSASGGGSRYAQPGDVGATGGEIWVMLMEKAWAGLRGGYDQAHSGVMTDGMTAVTGSDTDTVFVADKTNAEIFSEISTCVREGKPVAIQTKQRFTPDELAEMRDIEFNIFASHAYNVAGVNAEWQTIDIRNPHGNNHLRDFPLVRLRHFFDAYVMSEDSFR
jgi:hypothetical protein